jgi:hypothetical protein
MKNSGSYEITCLLFLILLQNGNLKQYYNIDYELLQIVIISIDELGNK